MSGAAKSPSLAPGFRFHPTDDELISYYLKRKLSSRPIRIDAIAEVDLYKFEPWDLPQHSKIRSRDLEWYFFSPLDKKYSNRSRTNRATVQGYWKTTGKDRLVRHGCQVVGMKKTLVFHVGRAPKGERTNWVMHEYRLEDENRGAAGSQQVYEQDGYVVCRIFQKNGVGPQNGAQYGAPFVEEEWEVEEEAADCLVMMADVAEDEGVQVDDGARAVIQHNQEEDQRNLECGNGVQVNPTAQDVDSHSGEQPVMLDGPIKLTVTGKIFDFVNQHGIHNDASATEDLKSVVDNGILCSNRDDGYLELKDLLKPSELESSLGINNAQCVVDGIDEQFLHDVFDIEDIVGDLNPGSKHPELSQMSLLQENSRTQSSDPFNSFDGGFHSFEDEDFIFYDAPSHLANSHAQIDELSKLHQPVGQPSIDEALDDFMAYFDASEDNIPFGTMGFSDSSEYFNSYLWDHSAAEEGSDPMIKMPSEASASSVIAGGQASALYANNQYRNDYENFNAAPDFQRNDDGEKPMSNSLVNMLASISAPPAFASEFPSGSGKAIGHISTTGPGAAVRFTAGLIQIHDLAVASNGEAWPLHKRGNAGLLLPYHDEVYKSVSFEPITKCCQGGALATMIRGGCFLFTFSAVILTLSYTVGTIIYSK